MFCVYQHNIFFGKMAKSVTDEMQKFKTPPGLNIHVKKGDITKTTADAIVVPEGFALKHLGMVGDALVKTEPKFKEKRDKLIKKLDLDKTRKNVYVTKLGKTFKKVLHAVLAPVRKCESLEDWRRSMALLYNNVLEKAEEEKIKCLALPLLGSGKGGANMEDAINVALDAIFLFEPKHLKWIVIVSQKKEIFDRIVGQCELRLSSEQTGRPPERRSNPLSQPIDRSKVVSGSVNTFTCSKQSLLLTNGGKPNDIEIEQHRIAQKVSVSQKKTSPPKHRPQSQILTTAIPPGAVGGAKDNDDEAKRGYTLLDNGRHITDTNHVQNAKQKRQDSQHTPEQSTQSKIDKSMGDIGEETGSEDDENSEGEKTGGTEIPTESSQKLLKAQSNVPCEKVSETGMPNETGIDHKKEKKTKSKQSAEPQAHDNLKMIKEMNLSKQKPHATVISVGKTSRNQSDEKQNDATSDQNGTEATRKDPGSHADPKGKNGSQAVLKDETEVKVNPKDQKRLEANPNDHNESKAKKGKNGSKDAQKDQHLNKGDQKDKNESKTYPRDQEESKAKPNDQNGSQANQKVRDETKVNPKDQHESSSTKKYQNRTMPDVNDQKAMDHKNNENQSDHNVGLQCEDEPGDQPKHQDMVGNEQTHQSRLKNKTDTKSLGNDKTGAIPKKHAPVETKATKGNKDGNKKKGKDEQKGHNKSPCLDQYTKSDKPISLDSPCSGMTLKEKKDTQDNSEKRVDSGRSFGQTIGKLDKNQNIDKTKRNPLEKSQTQTKRPLPVPRITQQDPVKESTNIHSDDQQCPICMGTIEDPKTLKKCGHVFCRECIDASFKQYKPVCPNCNTVYGELTGNQPEGQMCENYSGDSLPGYEQYGTIEIVYYFPDGQQGSDHPSPGQFYKGTTRWAYLPNNQEGKEVLELLKTAFNRKLTFTIGRSTTTGKENVVTWNDIHHKTNKLGGPTRFGYPDDTYLDRVRDELKSKGVM